MGNKVRWNGASKEFPFIKDWAKENNIKLTPVCPENELLGTPRPSIRLIQVGDEVHAHAGKNEISEQLRQTSKNSEAPLVNIPKSLALYISLQLLNHSRNCASIMSNKDHAH